MQKVIYAVGALLAVLGIGAAVILTTGSNESTEPTATTQSSDNTTSENLTTPLPTNNETTEGQARYIDYSEQSLANSATDANVLFFHADWCTICNSIERNVSAGTIPDNITIHKVNYDTERSLVDKYGITYQSAFVQVDKQGNQITKWQGLFGDDIDDILSNIQDA